MNIATPPQATAPRPPATARSITVLGATGSIGESTLDLVRRDRERFRIEALTAQKQVGPLAALAREFDAPFVAIADKNRYPELKAALSGTKTEIGAGEDALVEAARRPADWVMGAITGAAGLRPTLAAAERGAMVALANKECLVCAGDLFMKRAAECGAKVLPVDSEHNALYQAMTAGRRHEVHRVIITASGGPFREWTAAQIKAATLEQALKHPNWSMGQKITIDSATMMNKGLEVIEAHHLFALKPEEIEVVVHPQSIIHSLVEYIDGSQIAQLGPPDMRVPIAYCIAWPERITGPIERLDLGRIGRLTFEAPDLERFPALRLAQESLVAGGSAPTILNAANEIAVAAFLARKLNFPGIAALVEATLEAASARNVADSIASVDDALAVDHISRSIATDLLPRIAAMAS